MPARQHIPSFICLFTTLLCCIGSPLPRDGVSDAIAAAIPITNTYGDSLTSAVKTVLADPILSLTPWTNDGRKQKFDILSQLSTATETAVEGITLLPTLPASENPSQEVLDSYGPLVIAVARTLEFSLIDLKLLSADILDPLAPGYAKFVNGFDADTYQFVRALNAQFKGFSSELSEAVGKDTPLGRAINTIGGRLFAVVFDYQT